MSHPSGPSLVVASGATGALAGAATGALVGSGAGVVQVALVGARYGALAGGGANVAHQAIDGGEFNPTEALVATGIGAAAGALPIPTAGGVGAGVKAGLAVAGATTLQEGLTEFLMEQPQNNPPPELDFENIQ